MKQISSATLLHTGELQRNRKKARLNTSLLFTLDSTKYLRPLPDVAMTGKCTRECTEYGHSDSCWMPGQPSPTRSKNTKSGPKLSTFVPYQEREGQERLLADSSSKPQGEERSGGMSNKVASIRFLPPYTSAYSTGSDSSKDCPHEEIALNQTSDYIPATTPTSQGSKREIYL
ncbi:hypothetical protein DNTS_006455 [Danionella cerebrum]|uniref:Protocadherin domain-containing protein n=1 Tax=Danionella cerebrum TaxID=2873325 RepID=A0A553N3Y8_9TELE|nr:hypothetical protein DNTS_006455 [Danionella translucida]